MTSRHEFLEKTIHTVLTRGGNRVVVAGGGMWAFYPGEKNENTETVACLEVRLRDGWVLCRYVVPDAGKTVDEGVGYSDLERYALANPTLPGRSRVCLNPVDLSLSLRAEVLVVDGLDLARVCKKTIASLVVSRALLAQSEPPRAETAGPKKRARGATKKQALPATLVETLSEVSEASGWRNPKQEDETGKVLLTLASGGRRATVEPYGKHGVRLSADLSVFSSLSESSRRAVAALALTANGLMRLVRVGVDSPDGPSGVTRSFVETCFTRNPTRPELGFVLSSFAACFGSFGREFAVLADESVALRYLEIRGLATASQQKDIPGREPTPSDNPSVRATA
jgi:hypothetical protein